MHVPDGMMSAQVTAAAAATSAAGIGYSVSWVKRHLEDRKVVLISVMAALIFALQLLNFPIGAGVSGHFAGGAAAAIVLGPWPALIVMTTVLFVQALAFADGGIVAIGVNLLNLAIIGPLVGWLTWRSLGGTRRSSTRTSMAAFASGLSAVVASSLALACEMWMSGRVGLLPALAVLGTTHAVIGAVEGLLTAGLVRFVARARPDVIESGPQGARMPAAAALGVLALVAAAFSWMASPSPDALESFATKMGAAPGTVSAPAPFAGYLLPGLSGSRSASVLAALLGVALTALVGAALFHSLRSRARAPHARELHEHGHVHPSAPEHAHPHHHSEQDHGHSHTSSFERFTYVVSPVHCLDARVKLLSALAMVLGLVSAPVIPPVEVAFSVALLAALTLLARLPFSAMLKRSLAVLPFAAAVALYAPFLQGGWQLAFSIVAKAWLSALVALLVAATTPPAELVAAMRRLGLPKIFATTLTLLQRFAGALGEQLVAMRRAVTSRSGSLAGPRLLSTYGGLAGGAVVRSYARGERIHSAMLSRGFTGELPGADPGRVGATDLLVLALAMATGIALYLY